VITPVYIYTPRVRHRLTSYKRAATRNPRSQGQGLSSLVAPCRHRKPTYLSRT